MHACARRCCQILVSEIVEFGNSRACVSVCCVSVCSFECDCCRRYNTTLYHPADSTTTLCTCHRTTVVHAIVPLYTKFECTFDSKRLHAKLLNINYKFVYSRDAQPAAVSYTVGRRRRRPRWWWYRCLMYIHCAACTCFWRHIALRLKHMD